MTISLTVKDDKAITKSPYHPAFSTRAKRLGGKWNGECWTFDARDVEKVRSILLDLYGTDGTFDPPKRTLRVLLDKYMDGQSLWVAGRQVCWRPARDSDVRLGEGVIVVEGDFAPTGGSVKNPRLSWKAGTILEMRDVPESLAKQAVEMAATQGVIFADEGD